MSAQEEAVGEEVNVANEQALLAADSVQVWRGRAGSVIVRKGVVMAIQDDDGLREK